MKNFPTVGLIKVYIIITIMRENDPNHNEDESSVSLWVLRPQWTAVDVSHTRLTSTSSGVDVSAHGSGEVVGAKVGVPHKLSPEMKSLTFHQLREMH